MAIFFLPSVFNPLMSEINPSKQRCLPRFFTGDFKFYCLRLEGEGKKKESERGDIS
jgi:hypothetical protein